ncbi:MAG TPA: SHOCT domain-containing protein [Nocardioidaceae bacterium]|nr:SHOCT domain-containing protein [Nocardioidaceae bacterium]
MIIVLYAALLVAGVTLLAITAARVLIGGIADSPGRTTSARPTSSGSARRILDERYAAGEMSTDEYQHRLRVLRGGER